MNNETMIENIKKRLLFRYPHFGTILDSVEIIENKKIDTAGTDGKKIYYNPEFISKLNENEQLFIFAHEVCHIAFDHIYRSKGKDPVLWNIATDAVINAFLKEDGLPFIKGVVDIKDAIKFKAEQIYEKLLEKKEKENKKQGKNGQGNSSVPQEGTGKSNQSSNSSNNGNSSSQNNDNNQNNDSNGNEDKQKSSKNNDVGHDTHSLWEEAVKELEKELERQSKGINEEENNKSKDNSSGNKDNDSKEKNKSIEIDERKEFKQNREKVKEMLERYQEKKANDSVNAGKSSNGDEIKIADIGVSKQLIDWRKLLKEAIKYNIDWSYKNAVIEDGIVKAQLERYPIPETEILIDTSGSVSETLIRNFLRECKNIIKVSNVKAGCFDTKFYGFERIRSFKDIDNFKIKGRGGTNFKVAVKAFSKRVMNKIIFTDGKDNMPEDDRYVIWVVFGGYVIHPKHGKVIYINDKDLYRLINDYPSKGR